MSIFSFQGHGEFFQKNIRVHSGLEPAGCLGDLGWYCLRFALWAMKWQAPTEVIGRILSADGQDSGPLEFSGELFFAEGSSAGFYCSFLAPNQHWVNVSGSKGWLRLDDFVHPANPQAPSFLLNDVLVPVKEDSTRANQGSSRAQDVNMFRNFANQVRSGRLNEEWPQWSWKTQVVQDACLKSARNGGQRVPVAAF
jgi:predicted dehydrogenase